MAEPHFPQLVTSQVMVPLRLRECHKKCAKLSKNMANDSSNLEVNLSWLLPSFPSKVSISDKQPPDLLVNLIATNNALQSTCLTLCHVEQAIH